MSNFPYEDTWKKINKLAFEDGLPKSALKELDELWIAAKNDKNTGQQVKSLIWWSDLIKQGRDSVNQEILTRWNAELSSSAGPLKAIIHSFFAEMLDNYRQSQPDLDSRAYRANSGFDEFDTWSSENFKQEILKNYQNSIANTNKELLIPVNFIFFEYPSDIESVFQGIKLYDVLSKRYLDYLGAQPLKGYQYNTPELFGNFDTLASVHNWLDSQANDQGVLVFSAYLDVMRNALNERNNGLYFFYANEWLNYLRQNYVGKEKEKDKLYIKALQSWYAHNANKKGATKFLLSQAQFYYQKASQWSGTDKNAPEYSYYFKAHQLAKSVIAQNESETINTQASNIILEIETPALKVSHPIVVYPKEDFLLGLKFKNAEFIKLKLYTLTLEQAIECFKDGESTAPLLDDLGKLKNSSLEFKLPKTTDYREHSIELPMEGLSEGYYLLEISNNVKKDQFDLYFSVSFFQVNKLACSQSESTLLITNYNTGKYEPKTKVQINQVVCVYDYNLNTQKCSLTNTKNLLTDKYGFVKYDPFQSKGEGGQYLAVIGNGKAPLLSQLESQYRYDNKTSYRKADFFMDRAIYRPGQQLYYKAILYNRFDNHSKVLADTEVKIKLYNPNGQLVQEVSKNTNAFGTCNGEFHLPTDGITGQYYLQAGDGISTIFFNVEEYKRPTFEIKFEPITEAYKLGDTVTIKGIAKAFAGYSVQNAKVVCSVNRRTVLPYIDYFIGGNRFFESEEVHTVVDLVTDANGRFAFRLPLITEQGEILLQRPYFNFIVGAIVTDQGGEVQAGKMTLSVGIINKLLALETTPLHNRDKVLELNLSLKNINGSTLEEEVTLTATRIKSLDKAFQVNNGRTIPEYNYLSRSEFSKRFPSLPFEQIDLNTRAKNQKNLAEICYSASVKNPNQKIGISTNNWKPGDYVIEAMVVDGKDTLSCKVFTSIYGKSIAEYSNFLDIHIVTDKPSYKPGDIALVTLHGVGGPFWVNYSNGSTNKLETFELKGVKTLQVPINEADMGGVSLSFFANYRGIADLNKNIVLEVPWTNKMLKIEWLNIVDKMYPGEKTTWRFKISGNEGERVVAELLATMYDASLDQFKMNDWSMNLFDNEPSNKAMGFKQKLLGAREFRWNGEVNYGDIMFVNFWYLDFWGRDWYLYPENRRIMARMSKGEYSSFAPMSVSERLLSEATNQDSAPPPPSTVKKSDTAFDPIRTNLKETVFFIPNVMQDDEGNYVIDFTMNEALTKWNFMLLANTKELATAIDIKTVETSKDFMIQPNLPRFMRQNDQVVIPVRIINTSDRLQAGKITIELVDALTRQKVTALFCSNASMNFSSEGNSTVVANFTLKVPKDWVSPIEYLIVASDGVRGDGQQGELPVLSNRILVYETLPMFLRPNQKKKFVFESLKKNLSSTSQTVSFQLDYTANPAWMVIKALPYLAEKNDDCLDYVFSRYFSNRLAGHIANKYPEIAKFYQDWAAKDGLSSTLDSKTKLTPEILDETPWIRQSIAESEQRKAISSLFDIKKIELESMKAIDLIASRQSSGGSFAWVEGGLPNRYITQQLIFGLSHLSKLGLNSEASDNIVNKSLNFIIDETNLRYTLLKEASIKNKFDLNANHINGTDLQAIMVLVLNKAEKRLNKEAYDWYFMQMNKYWLSQSNYFKAMLILIGLETNQKDMVDKLIKSLKETAIRSNELGMYWKDNWGYYWYQLPVETQSMLIQAFHANNPNDQDITEMKLWLLKNKQTTAWPTTSATTEAIYALLLGNAAVLNSPKNPVITVGDNKLNIPSTESGTGYFQTSIASAMVNSKTADIVIENTNNNVGWGGAYWQYLEDLDKVKPAVGTPLRIEKHYFRTNGTKRSFELKTGESLKAGESVEVQLVLRVDRDLEFVQLKDLRAAGLEPVDVISGYKYGELGYYQSTKDIGTYFYMDYLPKGTHIISYRLRTNNPGVYSGGMASLICLYAPEFSSHSEGSLLKIE